MKILFSFIVALFFAFPIQGDIEDGWRGIKVFHTTGAEVEKILGQPTKVIDRVEVRYETGNELVRILYSGEPCSAPDTLADGYSVSKNTVVKYSVDFRGVDLPQLSEIKWDETKYVKE